MCISPGHEKRVAKESGDINGEKVVAAWKSEIIGHVATSPWFSADGSNLSYANGQFQKLFSLEINHSISGKKTYFERDTGLFSQSNKSFTRIIRF